MARKTSIHGFLALAGAAALACRGGDARAPAGPGAPLFGLDAGELARFARGKALFDRVFTPEEGLGPLYNENQCSACHTDPASGGTGEQLVVKATRFDSARKTCDRLERQGGLNVRRQATPAMTAAGITGEFVPPAATERGRFSPPFLFGAGLLEAVPDSEILQREDPDDRDGDGISGRAGRTADGRVGRFGRKGETATLVEFISAALRLEMGLTTALEPAEPGVNGRPLPTGTDPAADPEITADALHALDDFVRFLAPLAPETSQSPAALDSIERGARSFRRLGCAACHVPVMTTGPHSTPALSEQPVALYSDLLLHDIGPGLGDVCGITAGPSELRTEPLASLRYRSEFLHDARVLGVRDAIMAHGGEATRARAAFARLSPGDQLDLLRFLDTL